ncbi:hypothetical protein [Levilactobacillus sp. N40-8-2]|uniref:hypothetical protein n=1 Tax=Levilactobacillus muriae TaxID=3238987 RepID=UPI0038B23B8C
MRTKRLLLGTLTVLAIAGTTTILPTTSASAKRAVTPTNFRGTWQTRINKKTVRNLKITKFTFGVTDYKNGKAEEGAWTVGDKKQKHSKSPFKWTPLYLHKDKKGYTFIGANRLGQLWHLKRVTHKKRAALRDDGWAYKSFGEKPVVQYYYRVK